MSDDIEEVRGTRVVLRFHAARCIHSRHCVLDRPDVFVPNVEGAWIHPDNATPDELAELAHNCPSGAIAYERLDGGVTEQAPKVNTVRVRENGPLAFRAEVELAGHGRMLRATLCRCGQSKQKPFCDGSHTAAGFAASGEPATRSSEPLAVRDGACVVTPMKNAFLKVRGPLEVVSGTGRTLDRVDKAALCRCGGSQTKPYCDGTHRTIGFVADGE